MVPSSVRNALSVLPSPSPQISRSLAIGAAQTINLEPLGSSRLGVLTVIDLRVGKLFNLANNRSFEATSTQSSASRSAPLI